MKILLGDALEQLKTLESESVHCCVTSPPYWGLRDYGVDGQLGLEKTPEEYVKKMVAVFAEVKRVLRKDGTLWLNLGDSYVSAPVGHKTVESLNNSSGFKSAVYKQDHLDGCKFDKTKIEGLKQKDLVGIPWRVALALQADGWYLRQDIIWSKPNPMPESVTDRCTKSHEYIFLLTKSARYYYDNEAIGYNIQDDTIKRYERGWNGNGDRGFPNGPQNHIQNFMDPNNEKRLWANKKSVWTINTKPYKEAHFATFPPEIPRTCILAGSKKGDTILDPFAGSGTTGEVALKLYRNFIGIELNQKYINDLIIPRLNNVDPLFREAL